VERRGEERRGEERNEGAVVPNLEYGAVRRFPMRSEAAPVAPARAPARQDVASELGVFVVGGVVGGGGCTRTNLEVRPHGGVSLGPSPRTSPASTRVQLTGCRFAGEGARARRSRGHRVSWEQSAIVWRDEVTAGDPGRDHRNEPGVERSDTPGRPPPKHELHPVRGA
jgi:hypothetical protein